MIKDKLQARKITYTLEANDQLIVVESVPERVNLETGEQLFSPETVERLQQMVLRTPFRQRHPH